MRKWVANGARIHCPPELGLLLRDCKILLTIRTEFHVFNSVPQVNWCHQWAGGGGIPKANTAIFAVLAPAACEDLCAIPTECRTPDRLVVLHGLTDRLPVFRIPQSCGLVLACSQNLRSIGAEGDCPHPMLVGELMTG